MKQKKGLKPQGLRNFLGFVIFIIIAGGAGVFYLGLQQLTAYSEEVNAELQAADASEQAARASAPITTGSNDSAQVIQSVDSLFATQDSYKNQVTADIAAHAQSAQINATTSESQERSALYSFNVTFPGPIPYTSFVKFLNGIESNLPKMNVTSLTINRVESDNTLVTVTNMKIRVSVQ